MNISISFPNEIEDSLRRQAAARGQDVESFVRDLVTEVVAHEEDLASEKVPSPADIDNWLESGIALHPVLDHVVDDSRESIHAGRGE